jgi:hypothetical protein
MQHPPLRVRCPRRLPTPPLITLLDSDDDDYDEAEQAAHSEAGGVPPSDTQRLLAAAKETVGQYPEGLQPFVLSRRFVPDGCSLRDEGASTSAAGGVMCCCSCCHSGAAG